MRFLATHQDETITQDRLNSGKGLIASLDGKMVGTVTFYPRERTKGCPWYDRPDVAKVGQLAVEPFYQGQLIGTHLMQAVEHLARQNKANELALDTAEHATSLIDWYSRMGYRLIEYAQWQVTNYRSMILSKTLT